MEWTRVITSRAGWFDLNLGELWRYRDLIMLFVRRDFVATYKQTILGPFWFLVQPIVSSLVFTVIFGQIARIPTDGVPPMLFYMCGLVGWNYFAACMTKTSDTFTGNAAVFGKVYFPRLTVPVSAILMNLFTFLIQFTLLLLFVGYFALRGAPIHMTYLAFLAPVLVIQMAALGLGVGLLVSALTTKYRDLIFAMPFGVQLWMYATPIVYPMSQVPKSIYPIVALNPMVAVVEAFRYAFLGAGTFSYAALAISMAETLVILVIGIVVFSRKSKSFMDTV